MSKSISRGVFALLCMTCFVSCSNMIEWVEFHHNADIKNIESSAGQMRAGTDGDSAYALNLIPSDTEAYLRVTPENPDATMAIRVDGGEFVDLPAGTYSGNVAPPRGVQEAEIRVTSPSGRTVKTYPVRINRGGGIYVDMISVRGYRDGPLSGMLHFRITSPDRLTTYASAEIPASGLNANSEYSVEIFFPATTLYSGIEYRYGFMHDAGAVVDTDPGFLIAQNNYHTGFLAWLYDVSVGGRMTPLFNGALQSYVKLRDDVWNDPYTFVIP